MSELHKLGVAEAAKRIRDGEFSSSDLAQALLERIEMFDPALQAWVTVDREEVLSEARRRDEERDAGDVERSSARRSGRAEGHLLYRGDEDDGLFSHIRGFRAGPRRDLRGDAERGRER